MLSVLFLVREQLIRKLVAATLTAAALITVSGCSAADDNELVIYMGRAETLIQPLIDQYAAQSGVEVQVRYAGSAELAAQILEEGSNSPADVFMAQDAGALGAVSKAGLLKTLDADLLDLIDSEYRAKDGSWMGVSGRVRVLNYNPDRVAVLPNSVLDLAGPEWKGRVGIAPTNASFQAFVTALRLTEGEEVATNWLEAMKENGVVFEKNTAILEAVESGQVDVGLINHYYWYARASEVGVANMNSKIAAFDAQDVGNLRNVAGVGILSDDPKAKDFVEFLLSQSAQQYFVSETSEYPLIDGIELPTDLTPLSQIPAPDFDLNDLDALEETLRLIRAAGLI